MFCLKKRQKLKNQLRLHNLEKKQKIVAVQANNLSTIKINTDTTFLLCLEAQRRGFRIFWYNTNQLTLNNKKVSANGFFIKLLENKKKFYIKIKNLELDLSKAKYLLIRQNPPFNLEYINSTLYLEKLSSHTKIINNPISIRNISEKFYSSKFFRYMPPTIFTKDINKINKFYKKYKQLVIKPINGYAGKDIMFINKNFNKKRVSLYLKKIGHAMIQKFLPMVKKGDKRVFIINGKVCGAIKRVPSKNSILSNLSQGGTAINTTLNLNELKIAKIVAKDLHKNNIYFAGIDFVSGKLIGDINVTSPTGLPQFKQLTGKDLSKYFWNGLIN
tara:strand:- start:1075 stop:2064 length:990 start_codon:yes stop_codon:yes gene_type:complete